jgi:zinc transport system permease protein
VTELGLLEKLQLFLSSSEVWGGAVLAGVIAGAVCGFLGVYVILHRIVFVSAAMSEVSSLGVMVAFLLAQEEAVGTEHHTEDVLPLLLATAFTAAFSAFMARAASTRAGDRSRSAESFIGAVYLVSAAALLLVSDRVARGAHDVANVLFGNAVVVDGPHLALLVGVCVPILAAHALIRRDLLFASFDPAMALTLGYPVKALRLFLLVSLGIVISIGTRTIGALPVFSFSVLPPIACLALFQDLRRSFWASALLGALSALLGYLVSFLLSFPTGACMTAVAGVFLLLAQLLAWRRGA